MKYKIISIFALVGITVLGMGLPAHSAVPYTSPELKMSLKYIVEEEKLARDVYTVLAKTAAYPKFRNIANAEQFHMDQMSMVLADYGIWNPTLNRKPGVFFNKELSALYKTLITKGQRSPLDAIEVGIIIEEKDIADLTAMESIVTQEDIKFVISYLKAGSINHLAAFKR
jgi:hypothetical protein|uniref:DUF2202 domain-containing protein n=1 Tax=Candidatus Planktophila sp. TaxID=2175601 RepID=UPI0040497FB3